jgi:hypothetical protein
MAETTGARNFCGDRATGLPVIVVVVIVGIIFSGDRSSDTKIWSPGREEGRTNGCRVGSVRERHRRICDENDDQEVGGALMSEADYFANAIALS